MAKLNQIVASVAGKKTRLEKELGDLNKLLQKGDLFTGIQRTYQPLEEGGESLPPEQKLIQQSVKDVATKARAILSEVMDAVATQERSNCDAKSDVVVDGKAVLKDVPITVLLFIEKQLNDINTFVGNMPTLDPSVHWSKNENTDRFASAPVQTHRTKKIARPIVLYEATAQHPAQTQLIQEDVLAGYWTTQASSSAISEVEKRQIQHRVATLIDAVKIAREAANNAEAVDFKIAAPVLSFIFG